jgi:primase-polymerase (primpol)-like protein
MPLRDALLPEFDHEMANTRKSLERVPEDKFGWKPHEKSGTLSWLSNHLAEIPA